MTELTLITTRISDLVSRLVETVEYMTKEEELVEEEHAPTNASEIIGSCILFEYEVEKNYKRVKESCRVLVHKITNRLTDDNIDFSTEELHVITTTITRYHRVYRQGYWMPLNKGGKNLSFS